MPQPLSSKAQVGMRIFAAGASMPVALSQRLAAVVSTWAYLELELGLSLAKLLGGTHNAAGIAVVKAMLYSSIQTNTITDAAKAVLSGDELRLFLCLTAAAKSLAKRRNTIVHGIWGFSPDLPDSLLLIEPKAFMDREGHSARFWQRLKDGDVSAFNDIQGMATDVSHIYVYTTEDFDSLSKDILGLTDHFGVFWFMVSAPYPDVRDKFRRQLLSAPLLRPCLDRSETAE